MRSRLSGAPRRLATLISDRELFWPSAFWVVTLRPPRSLDYKRTLRSRYRSGYCAGSCRYDWK
jgi:hypothetical protein